MGRLAEASRTFPRAVSAAKAADDALEAAWPAVVGLVVILLLALAWLATDRDPPFDVVRVQYAEGYAGDDIALRADVRRELHRPCSALLQRHVIFVDGRRFDLQSKTFTRHEIEHQASIAPGTMAPVIRIPEWAPAGRATMVSTLRYRCNVTHELWPIEVVVHQPFTVLQRPPAD